MNKKGLMKKITMMVTIILTAPMNNAFQGSQLIQKEYTQPCKNQFLDAAAQDEYTQNEIDQQDLEEYDQHNCDNAQPSKPSAITALLTEFFGFMLMNYISLRETAHVYCHGVKEVINNWVSKVTKS